MSKNRRYRIVVEFDLDAKQPETRAKEFAHAASSVFVTPISNPVYLAIEQVLSDERSSGLAVNVA